MPRLAGVAVAVIGARLSSGWVADLFLVGVVWLLVGAVLSGWLAYVWYGNRRAAAAGILEGHRGGDVTVILDGPGARPIQVVKVLRELLGCSLAEARRVVSSAPVVIAIGVTGDGARLAATSLRAGRTGRLADLEATFASAMHPDLFQSLGDIR